MIPAAYQQLAARTICDMGAARGRLTLKPELIQFNHSLIGIGNELGELCSLFQKVVYYGKLFPDNEFLLAVSEEYGDMLWFMAEGMTALGLDLPTIMAANIAKLKARYPNAEWDQLMAWEENRNRSQEARAMLDPAGMLDQCRMCGAPMIHKSGIDGDICLACKAGMDPDPDQQVS